MVKRCAPSTVEENEVAPTGAPEAPPMAVCWIVESAVDDASIAYRRIIMLEVNPSADGLGISYAATLVASGRALSTKPIGTAKATPTLESETFGEGHAKKTQEVPARETEVPSGQVIASTGHAMG